MDHGVTKVIIREILTSYIFNTFIINHFSLFVLIQVIAQLFDLLIIQYS